MGNPLLEAHWFFLEVPNGKSRNSLLTSPEISCEAFHQKDWLVLGVAISCLVAEDSGEDSGRSFAIRTKSCDKPNGKQCVVINPLLVPFC